MQGLVNCTTWCQEGIQSFKQYSSTGIVIFTDVFPALEAKHVSTWLNHVVTTLTKNWDKFYSVRIVANFLL